MVKMDVLVAKLMIPTIPKQVITFSRPRGAEASGAVFVIVQVSLFMVDLVRSLLLLLFFVVINRFEIGWMNGWVGLCWNVRG